MPIPRLRFRSRKGKSKKAGEPRSRDLDSQHSAGTDCSDDEVTPDDGRFSSSMPNLTPTGSLGGRLSSSMTNLMPTGPLGGRFSSSMTNLAQTAPPGGTNPGGIYPGSITQGCRVVTYVRNRAGVPYHRGAQCCATPNVPAWKRHPSIIQGRTRTRFIDESLGIPSAVTEVILHPRKEELDLFYSKQDIAAFTEELEESGACYQFAKKMRINGKMTTVGVF